MSEKKTTRSTSSSKIKKTSAKKPVAKAASEVPAQNPYLIPGSIVIAGFFVALALYFSGGGGSTPAQVAGTGTPEPQPAAPQANPPAPITDEDHIFGDPNAPVKVIEYLDYNCGFCQRAHATFEQLVEDNGGDVAWVARHFTVLGDLSVKKAEASECVAELGGNDAFWRFSDLLFSDTYFQATEAQLPAIASAAGVNSASFQTCLASGRHADKVNRDNQDAQNAGGQGTPYSVVIAPNGDTFPVSGAQPLAAFQAAVDQALQAR